MTDKKNVNAMDILTKVYNAWGDRNDLQPLPSADEIDIEKLTNKQADFVVKFQEAWESAEQVDEFLYFAEKDEKDHITKSNVKTDNETTKSFFDSCLEDLIIPEDWNDISYGNDACPSFQYGRYHIFVDHRKVSKRESGLPHRFHIGYCADYGEFAESNFSQVCDTLKEVEVIIAKDWNRESVKLEWDKKLQKLYFWYGENKVFNPNYFPETDEGKQAIFSCPHERKPARYDVDFKLTKKQVNLMRIANA